MESQTKLTLYQHAKNQLIPSVHSWDIVSFRVQRPYWPHPSFTAPNQKIFDHFLIFVNLYQHAKNEAILSMCSGVIDNLNILQSVWLRGTQQIIQIFIIERIRWKFKFNFLQNFFKFKRPYFWPISSIFGANKVFSKNSSSVTHSVIKVSITMPKVREI